MSTNENLDLPWYVNNSLDATQRKIIETRLSQETELKLEAEFLQHIRQQIKHPPGTTPGEFGWQKLQRQISRAPSRSGRGWQVFAMAASLMLLVQGGVIFSLLQTDDSYVPLAGGTSEKPTLQIRFNPDIREAQMRQLLLDIHGQILEGPSANSVYRVGLEFPDQIQQYIETLRANDLVDHVAQN